MGIKCRFGAEKSFTDRTFVVHAVIREIRAQIHNELVDQAADRRRNGGFKSLIDNKEMEDLVDVSILMQRK